MDFVAETDRIFWPRARLQGAGPRGSSDRADSGVEIAVVPQEFNHPPSLWVRAVP